MPLNELRKLNAKFQNCAGLQMRYETNWAACAIFLTMFASGCERYDKPVIQPVQIPRLDARDESPCYDPGVEGNYGEALTANRVALASCRRKHTNVVEQYNSARNGLGPK